jgi:ribosomal protein S21
MVYTDTASHGKASDRPQRGDRVTPAIVARDPSNDTALRRRARSGKASGARARAHHEKPSVTRTRATLAACKARQREHMSD